MSSDMKPIGFDINVNDIFDELSDENQRLNNELRFANNCLNVLHKFKSLLNQICVKFETIMESEDKQELNRLEEEFNSVVKPKKQINGNVEKKVTEEVDIDFEANNESDYQMSGSLVYNLKKALICEFCDKQFKTHFNLNLHIKRIHTLDKPFKCLECDKGFVTKSELKEHQSIHSGMRFECEECHKIYKTIREIKVHKRQVHSPKGMVCEWPSCGLTFRCNFFLEEHRRKHIGTRDYKCNVDGCGKAFITRKTLTQHLEYHQKRFVCSWPQCGEKFVKNEILSAHMNRHQNIKPFKCTFNGCPKEYFNGHSLRAHLKNCHKTDTNV